MQPSSLPSCVLGERTLGKRFVPITISIDVSWVARGQGRGREEEEEEEEGRRNGLELRLESQKHR